jgi:hypothetical protein
MSKITNTTPLIKKSVILDLEQPHPFMIKTFFANFLFPTIFEDIKTLKFEKMPFFLKITVFGKNAEKSFCGAM